MENKITIEEKLRSVNLMLEVIGDRINGTNIYISPRISMFMCNAFDKLLNLSKFYKSYEYVFANIKIKLYFPELYEYFIFIGDCSIIPQYMRIDGKLYKFKSFHEGDDFTLKQTNIIRYKVLHDLKKRLEYKLKNK